MKNKKLAICLIIFACLVTIIILSSAIFALQSVSVNFVNEKVNITVSDQEIVDSADFSYGSNVLFMSKQKYIDNLEKSNPYIKILNLETVFPNKIVVNCTEREELFALQQKDGKYLIVDQEYKVLKIQNEFINTSSNAILLKGITDIENYQEGSFVNLSTSQKLLVDETVHSFREWKSTFGELKQKIESLEIDYERSNQVLTRLYNNVQIIVKDANSYNSDKFNLAFSTYDSDIYYQSDIIMEIRLTEDGKIKNFYTK